MVVKGLLFTEVGGVRYGLIVPLVPSGLRLRITKTHILNILGAKTKNPRQNPLNKVRVEHSYTDHIHCIGSELFLVYKYSILYNVHGTRPAHWVDYNSRLASLRRKQRFLQQNSAKEKTPAIWYVNY